MLTYMLPLPVRTSHPLGWGRQRYILSSIANKTGSLPCTRRRTNSAVASARSPTVYINRSEDALPAPSDQRILHVAVAGLPNAGKSTLVNYMVGDKVSAVSTKRHTTRRNSMGIMTVNNAQIFFHDTPGFVSHRDRGDYRRELSKTSRETIALVDLTLLVVDASKKVDDRIYVSIEGLLEQALRSRGALVVVLNKVDLVGKDIYLVRKKDGILDMAQRTVDRIKAENNIRMDGNGDDGDVSGDHERNQSGSTYSEEAGRGRENTGVDDLVKSRGEVATKNAGKDLAGGAIKKRGRPIDRSVDGFLEVFMTSALNGKGVEDIIGMLEEKARPGRWRFDRSRTSNLSEEMRATEIVRESLFTHLYKELPYVIEQHTNKLIRCKDNSVYFDQDLRLERVSQKGIVVGKLHLIHKDVQESLTKLFGAPVKIHFNVVSGKGR